MLTNEELDAINSDLYDNEQDRLHGVFAQAREANALRAQLAEAEKVKGIAYERIAQMNVELAEARQLVSSTR